MGSILPSNSERHPPAIILREIPNDSILFSPQKFVQGLSILSRGTLEEKLCWTFQLYDINSDGQITKEEMSDIVTAIYNLMAHSAEEKIDEDRIKAKVDRIFDVS